MENGYPKDCSREEYGDLVDVMSSNDFSVKALKIKRGSVSFFRELYVEYRQCFMSGMEI